MWAPGPVWNFLEKRWLACAGSRTAVPLTRSLVTILTELFRFSSVIAVVVYSRSIMSVHKLYIDYDLQYSPASRNIRSCYIVVKQRNKFLAGIAQLAQWLGRELHNHRIHVRRQAGARHLCLLGHVQTGAGAVPAFCKTSAGYPYPGIVQVGCEGDHSPGSSAEAENEWSSAFTPPCDFTAYTGTSSRNFRNTN
jgi:hypothetical protein